MQSAMITPCLAALLLVFLCTGPSSGMPSSARGVTVVLRGAQNPVEQRLGNLQTRIEARGSVTDGDTQEYFTILGEQMNNIVGGAFLNRVQARATRLTFHNGEATFTPANPATIPGIGFMWEGVDNAYNDVVFIGNEENRRRICRRVVSEFNNLQATMTGFLPNVPDHMAVFHRYTYCYQYFAYLVGNRNSNRRSDGSGGKGGKGGKGNGGKGGSGQGAWTTGAAAAAA